MCKKHLCLGLALFILCFASAPGWSKVMAGIGKYGDGAQIIFPQAFSEVPVIVTSGQTSTRTVMVAAVNNSKSGFDLKIRDLDGKVISSGVWVQWIAATYEPGIQLGLAKHNNGQHINFPGSLPGCTILTSGQKNGIPYLVSAVSNSNTGFDLSIRDHAGNSGNEVWTQWIAVTPRSDWRCGVKQFNDGQMLSFSAMSSTPVIFTSGQSGGAVSIGGFDNTKSGCKLSVLNHNGQPARSAWTQWWAVKSGIVSTAANPNNPPPSQPNLPNPPPPTQPTTPTGPVSTNDIIYLNSPRVITCANYGDKGGSKTLSSGGWSDFNKSDMYCRAYSLGAGFVFTGGSSGYWSKIGQMFDVQQGSYGSTTRTASIRVQGDYAGRIHAALLATSNAKLNLVVTDNGTQVASKQIFSKSGTVASWSNYNGSFNETLSVSLKAGHSYNVYLHLDTSAAAAIAGTAGADVGEGASKARYTSINITF